MNLRSIASITKVVFRCAHKCFRPGTGRDGLREGLRAPRPTLTYRLARWLVVVEKPGTVQVAYEGVAIGPNTTVALAAVAERPLAKRVWHGYSGYCLYGSAASRRPSSMKLKERITMTTAMPGIRSQGFCATVRRFQTKPEETQTRSY